MEAHAQLAGSPDFVVVPRVLGHQVQVIADRGAAGQEQLGQSHQSTVVNGLCRQLSPDGVEVGEPIEQTGVLDSRQGAGQRLIQVMVGVDQAGQHDHAGGVNHRVCLCWQVRRCAHHFDDVAPSEDGSVTDRASLVVHRHQHAGVL